MATVNRPPPAPTLSVLVIDDEKDLLAVIGLGLAPHRVVTATRAEDALARLRAGERFDAIVCDLMMPVVGGMEFYAEVRQIDPAQADRIGFVTGGAFAQGAQAFLDGLPGRSLEKPFRLGDLQALVRRLAGQSM